MGYLLVTVTRRHPLPWKTATCHWQTPHALVGVCPVSQEGWHPVVSHQDRNEVTVVSVTTNGGALLRGSSAHRHTGMAHWLLETGCWNTANLMDCMLWIHDSGALFEIFISYWHSIQPCQSQFHAINNAKQINRYNPLQSVKDLLN